MEREKRFIEKYWRGFPKKSRGRYSTKTYLCTVILLTATILGIFTTPNLLLGQWQNTEAATTDTWDGTTDDSWLNTGDGTEANPYIIATGAQLAGLASNVNSGNKYSGQYFKLTADIDLDSHEWTPIGYVYNSFPFNGNFDGGGHTISNLYIHDYDNGYSTLVAGLFGYTNGAKISNLNISGEINIVSTGKSCYAGGIAGLSTQGRIENCSSSVDISLSLKNMALAGGIVGGNGTWPVIINCYNTGKITAESTTQYASAGGIIGFNSHILNGCYNTGEVTAKGGTKGAYAGGLAGATLSVNSNAYISACYNIGAVTATATASSAYAGGLWALTKASYSSPDKNKFTVLNSYWLQTDGGVEHAYWATDYDETSYIDGGSEYGKSEAELKSLEILELLNEGSDIYVSDNNNVNKGYPVFAKSKITEKWETVADTSWLVDGQGDTEDNPYIITTAEQLAGIESIISSDNNYSGKYFKLVADIDLGGRLWKPIGTSYTFYGNFDGDGHTVSNLYINDSSYQYTGLFAKIRGKTTDDVTVGATVKNLNVSGNIISTFLGGSAYAGGLVGLAITKSTIENCSSSVNISAKASNVIFVGGIVGRLESGSSNSHYVKYCSNTGTISAKSSLYEVYAGGIVGENRYTNYIIGCYNTGSVTANGPTVYAGGLLGRYYDTHYIQYSYNVGKVSAEGETKLVGGLAGGAHITSGGSISITNSYWLEDCGASADYSGSSTTTRMKTKAELQGTDVLDNLNGGGTIYEADKKVVNNGFPVFKSSTTSSTDTWDGTTDTSWTGSGSKADPYIITTGAQLAGLASNVNGTTANPANTYEGKYFKLGADINLGGKEWTPIGTQYNYSFRGYFDGDGHTVSNLNINNTSGTYVGLFGCIYAAKISSLNVSGQITNKFNDSSVGGIAGACYYSSTIEYCSSSVNITVNTDYVNAGGFVGLMNESTIQYCYNTGDISLTGTNNSLGGIAGYSFAKNSEYIIGCYNTGKLCASDDSTNVGGIIGEALDPNYRNRKVHIQYSYNVGIMSGSQSSIGGLVGKGSATTTNSYWLEGCGASVDYSGSTTDGKKTAAELKDSGPNGVLTALNSSTEYGSIYKADTANENSGYPVLLPNIKLDVVYVDPSNGDDTNSGNSAGYAVKSPGLAKRRVNRGGTIRVCSPITISETETWDGTDWMLDDKKVTIEENTEGLTMFDVSGTLTVTNLNFKGSGAAINNNNGTVNLTEVEFFRTKGTSSPITSTGTVSVSGKVVIPKIILSSTSAQITGANNLTDGSSIAIQGAENDHKVVEGSMSDAQKAYFKPADSDNYRLIYNNRSGLCYYGRPTWSVNINTDTPGQIKLTPTLTNFIDGDKLTISVNYPEGAERFTMAYNGNDASCKFRFNSGDDFTEPGSITLTSSDTGTEQILHCDYGSTEPQYAGRYTGKVKIVGTLTEAT